MKKENLDALIICGNQYAGYEGAVLYMSGFEIVHRYVYVVVPLEGEPTLVFPRGPAPPAKNASTAGAMISASVLPGSYASTSAQKPSWMIRIASRTSTNSS